MTLHKCIIFTGICDRMKCICKGMNNSFADTFFSESHQTVKCYYIMASAVHDNSQTTFLAKTVHHIKELPENNFQQLLTQKEIDMKKGFLKHCTYAALAITMMATALNGTGCARDVPEPPETRQPLYENDNGSGAKGSPASSTLYVEQIPDLNEEFIRGVDISSVKAEYDSGVKYYDFDGNILPLSPDDEQIGFFDFLKECGVNWVRLRVWNSPCDKDGNSYGGGNNTLAVAKELGKLATNAGLRVLVNFHYSDFWADPNAQDAPKAWANLSFEKKKQALGEFTSESVQELRKAGVNLGMVQVGNETINGLCGETDWDRICELMNEGSRAIRDIDKNILIALHFTDVHAAGKYETIAKTLADHQVDYDIFATSYYPFWHGTTDNLTEVMKGIADTYHKKVMVAETSYAYTLEDGDGHPNNVNKDSSGITLDYQTSVQGQANAVSQVIKAVYAMGKAGIGVFYWEPAWIPVQVYNSSAANADKVLAANKAAWEKYGSGWASSYSGEYDPDNAGVWYGGSSWDNQAMFDFSGHPLESINVWKYIYTGTTTKKALDTKQNLEYTVISGENWSMPDKIKLKYTDDSMADAEAAWEQAQVDAAKKQGVGTYQINGTAAAEGKKYPVTCTLKILNPNLLKNPGFEEEDMSSWNLSGEGVDRISDTNSRTGDYSLKYWSENEVEFRAEQKVILDQGNYTLSAYTQGGFSDNGDDAVYELYATVKGKEYSETTTVSSWQNWTNPTISPIEITEDNTEVTVGVYTRTNAGGWGSWDDFYLRKADAAEENNNNDNHTSHYMEKGKEFTDKGSNGIYKVTDTGQLEYIKPVKSTARLTIPATVKNSGAAYQVTSVAEKAMKGNKKLKTLIIGKNVKSIGKQAFYNCKKLNTIVIDTTKLTVESVGENAFSGTSAKGTVIVPTAKKYIYRELLWVKGLNPKIKI